MIIAPDTNVRDNTPMRRLLAIVFILGLCMGGRCDPTPDTTGCGSIAVVCEPPMEETLGEMP